MKGKSFVEKEDSGQVNTRVIVGLDIGTTKIACFIGRKNEHNKIEIISMGKSESMGVMHGVVANIEKTVQSITAAVNAAQLCKEGTLSIKNVYVGIAGQHIKSIQHRGMYTKRKIQVRFLRRILISLLTICIKWLCLLAKRSLMLFLKNTLLMALQK